MIKLLKNLIKNLSKTVYLLESASRKTERLLRPILDQVPRGEAGLAFYWILTSCIYDLLSKSKFNPRSRILQFLIWFTLEFVSSRLMFRILVYLFHILTLIPIPKGSDLILNSIPVVLMALAFKNLDDEINLAYVLAFSGSIFLILRARLLIRGRKKVSWYRWELKLENLLSHLGIPFIRAPKVLHKGQLYIPDFLVLAADRTLTVDAKELSSLYSSHATTADMLMRRYDLHIHGNLNLILLFTPNASYVREMNKKILDNSYNVIFVEEKWGLWVWIVWVILTVFYSTLFFFKINIILYC